MNFKNVTIAGSGEDVGPLFRLQVTSHRMATGQNTQEPHQNNTGKQIFKLKQSNQK